MNLLKKDEKFVWNEVQDKAFRELRDLLCSEPLLQYPDFTKPFTNLVTMDAYSYAIGDILSRKERKEGIYPLHTFPSYLIRPNRIILP